MSAERSRELLLIVMPWLAWAKLSFQSFQRIALRFPP